MLVLARQLNERIVMPTVPATIEVVAIRPNGVRLGLEAAADVPILREEVLRRGGVPPSELLADKPANAATRLQRIKHVLRNRLQTVSLGLDLLREQMGQGDPAEVDELLQRLQQEIRTLEQQLRPLLSGTAEAASPADARWNPDSAVVPCALGEPDGEFSI
jgi:carbon storage regulator CsrA